MVIGAVFMCSSLAGVYLQVTLYELIIAHASVWEEQPPTPPPPRDVTVLTLGASFPDISSAARTVGNLGFGSGSFDTGPVTPCLM